MARTLESLCGERRERSRVLRVLEPFDGRYLGRLSPDDLATIRAALADVADVMPQDIQRQEAGHKTRIELAPLRAKLAETERLIGLADTLDTLPERDEYQTAFDAFKTAAAALYAASERAGINRGELYRLIPIASFPA